VALIPGESSSASRTILSQRISSRLKRNHESLFEAHLRDPTIAEHWQHLGGLETLYSYGVPVGDLMMSANYGQAATALKAAVRALLCAIWLSIFPKRESDAVSAH